MLKNHQLPQVSRLMARDLAARRGEDLLFEGVELDLGQGEALVLTGANGSGKSTLLRVLAGLLQPDKGAVQVTQADGKEDQGAGACSHYFGHRNAMKSELSARENLLFWRRMFAARGSGDERAVESAAEAVGLSSIVHLPFGYLSAGQQRRIAFAKLLVAPRPIWLLDEPTTALDADSDKMFAGLIEDHRQRGGIVIAATHRDLGLRDARLLKMTGFIESSGGLWK